MWSSLFVNIIISILIIFIAHSLWNYIKNTYSTKKTKDLIGSQIQKYKTMIEQIQIQNQNQNQMVPTINPPSTISMENDLAKWMEESIGKESLQKESLQTEFQNNNI